MDNLLVDIGDGDADRQNEINALTIRYNNKMRKQRPDRVVAKTNAYLKSEGLKTVLFDKEAGFCLLTDKQYQQRLQYILHGNQFAEVHHTREDPLIKLEKKFNKELLSLYQNNKIDKDFNESVRSTGAQPTRLFGLAKVHKPGVPLRPVLSLPGSSNKLT